METRTEKIEEGDIFFFYRPKIASEKVRGRGEVQRFYMVLAPDAAARDKHYRLFILGRKKLPQVRRGKQHPERRNWALNTLTTAKLDDLRRELAATEYQTRTRGRRQMTAARPVGEGRYQLLRHRDHTEIAYALELPKEPGPAQDEFEIRPQASYVVAAKNPEVATPGAPAASEPPRYPAKLQKKFGTRRWIDVDDPALLDYENMQLLLLGAHAGAVQEELGIEIDEEEETARTAEVCGELELQCERPEVRRALFEGEFPDKERIQPEAERIEKLPPERSPGRRGGRKGGRAAARRAPSAAAIAKLLKGIHFPKERGGIVEHARRHRDRLERADEALATLRKLPDRRYRNMADVAKGIGEVR